MPVEGSRKEKPPLISDVAAAAGEDGESRASTLAKATADPFSSTILPATSTSAGAEPARQNIRADTEGIGSSEWCLGHLPGTRLPILHTNQPRREGTWDSHEQLRVPSRGRDSRG